MGSCNHHILLPYILFIPWQDLDEASRKSAEEEVQKWVVDLLGGRVVYIVSGTAPTSPEVLNFLTRIVGVAVIDIYGSTVSRKDND